MKSPYRWHVDRWLWQTLPTAWALKGLDVGGPSPLGHTPTQTWESINPDPRAGATYQGYVEDLGTFPDAEFDIVQATDMLYLVQDVPKALFEMWRVAKAGGVLVATVPFCWPPSSAQDWGRWTPTRWTHWLNASGWQAHTLTPLGGPWTMVEQVLHDALEWWPPLLCRLDRRMTWPVGFGIVATK